MRIFILFLFCVLCFPSISFSAKIYDSTTSNTSITSTLTSLNTSQVFNVAASIPIGTIVAFPVSKEFYSQLDSRKWLECNGGTIPAKFTELIAILGSNRLPDLNNKFLRGSTSADLETERKDTIRDHKLLVPEHIHKFEGKITTSTIPINQGSHAISFNINGEPTGSGSTSSETSTVANITTQTLKDVETDELTDVTYTRPWFAIGGDADYQREQNADFMHNGGYAFGSTDSLADLSTSANSSYKYGEKYVLYCKGEFKSADLSDDQFNRSKVIRTEEDCYKMDDGSTSCSTIEYRCVYEEGWIKVSHTMSQPAAYAHYIERWYNGVLNGPNNEVGGAYVGGMIHSIPITGSISQTTQSSKASAGIKGSAVYGRSDSTYGKNGTMVPTNLNGSEISSMKAWYISEKDKNGKKKTKVSYPNDLGTSYIFDEEETETAPMHTFVRYFIRAEL